MKVSRCITSHRSDLLDGIAECAYMSSGLCNQRIVSPQGIENQINFALVTLLMHLGMHSNMPQGCVEASCACISSANVLLVSVMHQA